MDIWCFLRIRDYRILFLLWRCPKRPFLTTHTYTQIHTHTHNTGGKRTRRIEQRIQQRSHERISSKTGRVVGFKR